MSQFNQTSRPRKIAAIDLGSNSFHMVIARIVDQELQILFRHKESVRLGAGLNDFKELNETAIKKGVDCLAMFAERLEGFAKEDVKTAATFTLRAAKNKNVFLERAQKVFPFPIEIISGDEEARLIYQGVSQTISGNEKKLVIDIGGGSTEFVIGKEFDALLTASKNMGCVSYTKAFFADGKISSSQFEKAELACEVKLERLAPSLLKQGWKSVFGSSGTIKSISEMLIQLGYEDGVITKKRLNKLISLMLLASHYNEFEFTTLSPERKSVIAAGVAILSGIFNALNIEKMHYSPCALREGLLYEMENTFKHQDIRMRTATNLAKRYVVNLAHASIIQGSALSLYQQYLDQNKSKSKHKELKELLSWAALLHEIGLSIAHSGFHKHSAYLLQYTTMPGFNQEQQQIIAVLARLHRKTIKLKEIPEFSLFKQHQIFPLIQALRLACILNISRINPTIPKVELITNNQHWLLHLPKAWFEKNRLLATELNLEQILWQNVQWKLEIKLF